MPPFMYRCPTTGFQVQGYTDEVSDVGVDEYLTTLCTVCQQIHLVNPATNEILGYDDE